MTYIVAWFSCHLYDGNPMLPALAQNVWVRKFRKPPGCGRWTTMEEYADIPAYITRT